MTTNKRGIEPGMKQRFTFEDLNRITMDYCLRDEETAGQMMLASADGGPDITRKMAEECRKRGIDPVKAMEGEIKRSNDLWKRLRGR